MPAGHGQLDRAELLVAVPQLEPAAAPTAFVGDDRGSRRRRPSRTSAPRGPRARGGPRSRRRRTRHARPGTRSRNDAKAATSGVEAAVVVEMVGLDVGDDRRLGLELEERAVALVGLDDEPVALVVRRVRADLVEVAADDEARAASPRPAARAPASTRRWSCRGSPRPRRPDASRRARAASRRAAAPVCRCRSPPRPRGCCAGSPWTRRRRPASAGTCSAACPTWVSTPSTASRCSVAESLRSEPRHAVAHPRQHGRDRAHPGTADPDDVEHPGAREVDGRAHRAAPTFADASTRSATRSVASGRPRARAACPMVVSRPGSASSAPSSRSRRAPSSSSSVTITAAPADASGVGVARLVVGGCTRQRHEDRRRPGRRRARRTSRLRPGTRRRWRRAYASGMSSSYVDELVVERRRRRRRSASRRSATASWFAAAGDVPDRPRRDGRASARTDRARRRSASRAPRLPPITTTSGRCRVGLALHLA